MKSFNSLNLPAGLLANLERMGFRSPTPIQAQAIPHALAGKDVMGMAQTGTGKTAAFSIPLVSRLMKERQARALVLAPTRELALQIFEVLRKLTQGDGSLRATLLIGGVPVKKQARELASGPRIFIATPGRLMDHLQHQPKLLEKVSVLVVDEADRMLDMGFLPQLKQVRKYLPRDRQTMMFSATFPENIRRLAGEMMKRPQEVRVGAVDRPIAKIRQDIVETTAKEKNDVLLDELNARQGSVLIFTRTRQRTDRLMRFLDDYGYPVVQIHGMRTQAQRQRAIEGFRKGEYRILVATDIAARGLDIDDVAHVINYDLPQAAEDYVHRIGRTARNGRNGHALCLLTPEDRNQWRSISRALK